MCFLYFIQQMINFYSFNLSTNFSLLSDYYNAGLYNILSKSFIFSIVYILPSITLLFCIKLPKSLLFIIVFDKLSLPLEFLILPGDNKNDCYVFYFEPQFILSNPCFRKKLYSILIVDFVPLGCFSTKLFILPMLKSYLFFIFS